jgi:hypothetical protein
MVRPGEIYAPTISSVELSGSNAFTTRTRAWIDFANSRARGDVEASFGGISKQSSWVIADSTYVQTLEYDPPYVRQATTCRGSEDPLVSLLLACRVFGERGITTTVADGDYHGQPAVVVLTRGVTDEDDGHTYFIETLFLDPGTYLPIAVEGSGHAEKLDAAGNVVETVRHGRMVAFEHSFVPADSVNAEVFDAAGFGYQRRDPVAAITRPTPDFTAYWLGERPQFEDLPEIELGDSLDVSGTDRPALRYRALVTYRPAGDEFGPTLLQLEQWRHDEWAAIEDDVRHTWRDAPCVQRRTVDVGDDRSATIYSGFGTSAREDACPSEPTEHSAMVSIGETVIRVSAPADSPYNSERAIRSAVEALVAAN